ncbi:hypothetical protein ACYZTX_28985 [Pseudomonas sp. MDT1-17]
MDEPTPLQLIPCRYYRFCQGHRDPAQPAKGSLCPDCFAKIDEGYEQVEMQEQADQLAAQEDAGHA